MVLRVPLHHFLQDSVTEAPRLVPPHPLAGCLQTDPTRFLSGSDDGTVRLWNMSDESAVACIDSKANVCSVQFCPNNSNLMAFGSANYRVYLYDLRQVSF